MFSLLFAAATAILLLVVLVLFKGFYRTYTFFSIYRSKTPKEQQAPIAPFNYGFGQVLELLDSKTRYQKYLEFSKISAKNNGIAMFHHPAPWIILTDPQMCKQLLVSSSNKVKKPHTYDLVSRVSGKSLLTLQGSAWKRERTLFNPVFSSLNMESLTSQMESLSLRLVDEYITKKCKEVGASNGGDAVSLAVSPFMSHVTIRVLAGCIMGVEDSKLLDEVADTWDSILKNFFTFFLWSLLFGEKLCNFLPFTKASLVDQDVARLRAIAKRIIEAKKKEMEEQKTNRSSTKKGDLLEIILQAQYEDSSYMNEELMVNEIVTFLLAGHETTSSTLGFTLKLLSENEEWQQKLFAEIEEALQGGSVSYEKIKNLKNLDAVIKESLRLFPPIYIVDRENTEDMQLGNHYIPKGALFAVSFMGLHRNESVWKSPEVFDPSRWFSTSESSSRFDFLPFSGGSRDCVGRHFAQVELKIVLAMLIMKFKVQPVTVANEFYIDVGLTMKANSQWKLKFSPRE